MADAMQLYRCFVRQPDEALVDKRSSKVKRMAMILLLLLLLLLLNIQLKDLSIESQRMWNMKSFVIPVIIGATEIVNKGLKTIWKQ
jgi:hypothetical protein